MCRRARAVATGIAGRQFRGIAIFWGTALAIVPVVFADVELPSVMSNHMVLQSGMPVPIWGTSEANEAVVVKFAGQEVATQANRAGNWRVTLTELESNETPRELVIQGNNVLRIHDVLVGEVWYCAGQSNMEWPLKKAANAKFALRTSKDAGIRLLYLRGAARGGSGDYTAEHLSRLDPSHFCQGTWTRCDPATAKDFSAVGYFFAQRLRGQLKVPVGMICSAIGGTPAEAWVSRDGLNSNPETAPIVQGDWMENSRLSTWCQQRARSNFSRARESGETIPGDDLGPHHSFKPTFMYESGVAPVIPFAIRGAIWYQGESNAESPERVVQHESIFRQLVQQWRAAWGQGEFPFIFVQLPALRRPDWPAFRDQQRRQLDLLPNLGMAITMDVGHPSNVHPPEKQTVGIRLANWALANTYGQMEISGSGPLVDFCRLDDSQLRIRFANAGEGLMTNDGQPPRHVEILDEHGKWHALHPSIDGGEICAHVADIHSPRKVRYAWQPYPVPPLNVVNSSGTPASPFEIPILVGEGKPAPNSPKNTN